MRKLLLLAMLTWTVLACAKTPPKPANAKGPASPTAAAAPAATPTTDADFAKLAAAYHAIRCQLVGAVLPDEAMYTSHGYADGSAFQAAFSAAAKVKPDWAKQTVADSLARACGEPGAPTPTAPAASVSPVTP